MNNGNENLNSHKRNDAIKWILALTGFILVAVVLVGIVCGWFTKKDDTMSADIAQAGEMIVTSSDDDKASGIALTSAVISVEKYAENGISPIALTAQTITATVKGASNETPDYMQYVTFEAKWATTNSAAVTDYITMTTTDRTATVSCKKAFSTQIIVTATSVIDETKSGSVTLDYAKGFSSFKIKVANTLQSATFSGTDWTVTEGGVATAHFSNYNTKTVTPGSSKGSWSYPFMQVSASNATWGEGTIANSVTNVSVSMKYSDAFVKLFYNDGSGMNWSGQTYTGTSFGQWDVLHGMINNSSGSYADRYLGSTASSNADIGPISRFMSRLDTAEKPIEVTLTLTLQYGSAKTFNFYIEADVEAVPVSGVDMSGNLIFYA